MSHGTRGVSMDFHALSKFGVDSHKKIIHRPTVKPVKRKNLDFGLTKEELGFWDDANGVEFCKSFDNCSLYQQGDSDDDTIKKSDSSPVVPDSQDQTSDEVKLHPEKDLALDSNTSSPVATKPVVTARNTRSSTATGRGAKSKLQQSLKEQRKTVSAVISAKKEEEKLLKQEHDLLELEVMQGEKLQDSIDQYKEKIKALKKRKSSEKKKKFSQTIDSDEDCLIIPPSQQFSKHGFDELKGRLGPACKLLIESTGLGSIINENHLIADLMARAASRKKKRRLSRESKKNSKKPALSSSSSEDFESDSSSEEDQPKQIMGGAAHNIQGKRKKLKSGITEKSREADITVKLKWASSMLGAKREVSSESLTFDQYMLGESQILNRPNISDLECNTQIYLMKRISKLNEKISFSKSKELYRETLLSIEKGEFTWDNFYEIEKIKNEIRFEHES